MSSNIIISDIATTSGTYTISPGTAAKATYELTMSGDLQIACSDCIDGASILFVIKQDASGGREISWSSDFRWPGGVASTATTTPSATDVFQFGHQSSAMHLLDEQKNLQST